MIGVTRIAMGSPHRKDIRQRPVGMVGATGVSLNRQVSFGHVPQSSCTSPSSAGLLRAAVQVREPPLPIVSDKAVRDPVEDGLDRRTLARLSLASLASHGLHPSMVAMLSAPWIRCTRKEHKTHANEGLVLSSE